MNRNIVNQKCYSIADFFNLSQDVTFNDFVIHMMGNHCIIIENYKCIQNFSSECIVIKGNRRKIMIKGKNIIINSFGDKELELIGAICEISYL